MHYCNYLNPHAYQTLGAMSDIDSQIKSRIDPRVYVAAHE